VCNVDLVEGLGLPRAINWIYDLHFDYVDFALDSKTMVNAFNKDREDAT